MAHRQWAIQPDSGRTGWGIDSDGLGRVAAIASSAALARQRLLHCNRASSSRICATPRVISRNRKTIVTYAQLGIGISSLPTALACTSRHSRLGTVGHLLALCGGISPCRRERTAASAAIVVAASLPARIGESTRAVRRPWLSRGWRGGACKE